MKRSGETKHDANGKRKSRRSKDNQPAKFDMEKAKKEWTSEELDLTREIRPLTEYLSDKKKLIAEVFLTLRGKELREMIPKILKSYSLEDLKKLCLGELQNLSDSEIIRIMTGKPEEIAALSRKPKSGDNPCSAAPTGLGKHEANKSVGVPGCEIAEALDLHADQDEVNSLIRGGVCKKKGIQSAVFENTGDESQSSEPLKEAEGSANRQLSADNRLSDAFSEAPSSDEGRKGDWLSVFTKTQMEILELELRAKAIRSLMQAQNASLSDDEDLRQNKTQES